MSRFTIFSPQFYPRDFASPALIVAAIPPRVENFPSFHPQSPGRDATARPDFDGFRVQAVIRRPVEMLISPSAGNGPFFINIPSCVVLGGIAIKAMEDYSAQKAQGKKPVFKAANIGMDTSNLEYWK